MGGTKTWQLSQKPRPCPDVCVCGGGGGEGAEDVLGLRRAKLGVSGNWILVSLFLPGKPVPGPQAGLVALGPADYRCHYSGSCFRAAPPSCSWQAPQLPSGPIPSRLGPGSQFFPKLW